MAARAPVDSLDAALTDLERLTILSDNLASSLEHYDDIMIVLFNKEFENIKLRSMVTSSNSTIANLKRLGDLCDRLSFLGDYGLDTEILSEPAFQIVAFMSASHAIHAGSEPDGSSTELQQLKDIEHWITIKSIVETFWPEASSASVDLDHMISHGLERLQPFVAEKDCDRPTLVEMLELSVKIRIGLACVQVKSESFVEKSRCRPILVVLDELIADIISRLQETKSVPVSSMHSQETSHNRFESASKDINELSLAAKPLQELRSIELQQSDSVHEDQIEGLRSKINELEAELSTTELDKQAMKKDKDLFRGLIHQLEQEKGKLERALINGKQLSAMLLGSAEKDKEAYRKSQAEVLKGKALLAETEKDRDGSLRILDELREENSQRTKELARTSATINKLMEEKISATNAAAKEIQCLRVDKAALEVLVEITCGDLERRKKELADAKKGLKPINSLHKSAGAALNSISSNIDKVTADNVRLEEELANVKKALKKVRSSQKSKNIAGLKQSITGLEMELVVTKETINSFRVSSEEIDTENVKLAEENIRLNNDLETQITKVDELTTNNAHLKQELADMQNTQDRISLPQKVVRELEQQLVRSINALNKSRICQKKSEKEMKKLSASNSRLQTELTTATELVEELTATNAHLEDHFTDMQYPELTWSGEFVAELPEDIRLQQNESSRLKRVSEAAKKSVDKLKAGNARLEEELAASRSTENYTWLNKYAAGLLDSIKQSKSRLGEINLTRDATYARIDELTLENSESKKELAVTPEQHADTSGGHDLETATWPSNAHDTTTWSMDAVDEAWMIELNQEPYSDSDSWSLEVATPAFSSSNSPQDLSDDIL